MCPSGMPSKAVIITRPEPGASETADRVAALGLIPIVAPVMEIRSFPVRAPVAGITAIVIASGNAVASLPECCHELPLLAVGAATARRAEQAGFTNVISADGDGIALASLVRTRLTPGEGTLLLASAQRQGGTLAADLRASGYRVARRVAYASTSVPRLPDPARKVLMEDPTATVLIFSAETARHFLRLVDRAGLLKTLATREAITIGPQVAMALREVLWARIRAASQPTQDEMLALLR